jgi:hypothetical protein
MQTNIDAPVMSTYYLPLCAAFQHKLRFNLAVIVDTHSKTANLDTHSKKLQGSNPRCSVINVYLFSDFKKKNTWLFSYFDLGGRLKIALFLTKQAANAPCIEPVDGYCRLDCVQADCNKTLAFAIPRIR